MTFGRNIRYDAGHLLHLRRVQAMQELCKREDLSTVEVGRPKHLFKLRIQKGPGAGIAH